MACPLNGAVRPVGTNDVQFRMILVRSPNITGSRQGDRMLVSRAALGCGQIVIPVALEQMWRLSQASGRARIDVLDRTNQAIFG